MADRAQLMNPALKDFWAARGKHIKSLWGGRASSKTWDAAGAAIVMALHSRGRILCTREFQNKIDDSVYDVLVKTIERFNAGYWFDVQRASIVCKRTGTDFLFYGRARNFEQIKGTEGVTVHWGEECEMLTKPQHEAIDGTISRNQGAQHWYVFNPRYASDFVYKLVTSGDPDVLSRKINYDENPFLAQTMLDVIAKCKREDYESYLNLYEGIPISDDDAQLIKTSWIEACVDAHIKLGNIEAAGMKTLAFDVADDGGDMNANVMRHGQVISWADEWRGGEDELVTVSVPRTANAAIEQGAHRIVYDSIGVGAFVGSKLSEIKGVPEYFGFAAGGSVDKPDEFYLPGRKNKDHFANVKAQVWWDVANRFRKTYQAIVMGVKIDPSEIISLSSDLPYLDKLKAELGAPRRSFDRAGRVMVESKADMRARGVKSPNIADGVIMCYAPIQIPAKGLFEAFA